MAPRKATATDTVVERRRSTRIAVQPKAGEKPAPKLRVKKTGKKRVADMEDVASKDEQPQTKKVFRSWVIQIHLIL
jgi:hypothetical protein